MEQQLAVANLQDMQPDMRIVAIVGLCLSEIIIIAATDANCHTQVRAGHQL
jgi:hypothetical protein